MRRSIKAGMKLLLLTAVLLGAGIVGAAAPVMGQQAPDNNIQMRVVAGLNGHVKYGEWLPLHVRLTNNGADVDAEVRVEAKGNTGQVSYAAPAPLPAGARKEVILYVQPPSFTQALAVRLVSDQGVLAEAQVDILTHPRSAYLIGALASAPDALAPLNGLSLTGRDAAQLLPLALETLPARAEALRSLDCLILSATDTSTLTPAQALALQIWVEEGGRLLIGGGAGAARTLSGLPTALRPVELGEITDLMTLDSLADFAGHPIQGAGPFPAALPGEMYGRLHLEEEGQALMVQMPLGLGWATYLALDPAGSPFNAWTGTTAFWRRLLEPGAALELNVPRDIPARALESEQMGYALNNLPSLELPSIRWLTLLLGCYILLVGPVNYLVLRQVGRMEFAWVTIPFLTLLFSVGGYGLGYGLRGNDVIIHQISIVTLHDGSEHATARAYIGLFSPTRDDYELQVGTDALIGPLSSENRGMVGGDVTAPLNILQGNPTVVRGLGVNQWAMQSIQAETRLEGMGSRVKAELAVDGDSVRGTLRNDLAHGLEGVVIVFGNRFAHLGDVAAEHEVRVDAALEGDSRGTPFPWSMFQDTRSGGLGVPSRESTLRTAILSAFFHTNWGPPAAPAAPMLLAWTEETPIVAQVSGVRASHQGTTLLVLRMPLVVTDGRVKLPFGVLSSQFLEFEREAGACGGNNMAYLYDGSATLEYTLPVSFRDLHLSKLQLRVDTDSGPWPGAPAVALYDWSAGVWTEVTAIEQGVVQPIDDPEHFLDQTTGALRLRVSQQGWQRGMCYQFDVALEGQLASSSEEIHGE